MTESGSGSIFDLDEIRQLAELMRESELHELELRDETRRIRLRRGSDGVVVAPAAAVAATPASAPAPASTAADEENYTYITAPMVGTFYSRPNPNAASYVKVGDHVAAESTVCIVEAMKVFNEIPAEVSGKVVAVLVEDGVPVEFGQKLFRLESS